MIRVGILIGLGEMPKNAGDFNSNSYSLLLHMAPSYGVELCLFSHYDVNHVTNTVNGLFIVNGKPVRRNVPIPPIIDNKSHVTFNKKDKKMQRESALLEKKAYFARKLYGYTKIGEYQRLSSFTKSGGFTDLTIPTQIVPKNVDICKLADELGDNLIIKPDCGGKGRGVFSVVRKGEVFEVVENHGEPVSMQTSECEAYIDKLSLSERYIVQKRVYSNTLSGNPFDVRILIQRVGQSTHTFIMYPRIGKGKILSNIAAGGKTMPIDPFLEENFGKMATEIKAGLEKIGRDFPPFYQRFLKYPFFDMGLDIGIEMTNDSFQFYLFESNSWPLFDFNYNLASLHMKIARATLEHYRYLHDKLGDSPATTVVK